MKRTLKYLLRREAYNQTKKMFRELERGGKNDRKTVADEPKKGVNGAARGSETRSSGTRSTHVAADSDLKDALQRMDNYEFEHFVGDLWEQMGWSTEVSTQSADKGIDVIATRRSPYEEKALIQAKRYGPNTTVGSPDIQQYASLKHQRHGVDKVLVVTTNGFSGQAEEIAHKLNVKLVDGDDLVALVSELEARDLVEKYVPTVAEPEPEPEIESVAPSPDFSESKSDSTAESRAVDPLQSDFTTKPHSTAVANDGLLTKYLPDERWKWVAGATGAWVLGAALSGTDLGLVMLIAWVGLPYAILKDGHWTRFRRWYAAAALMPVFAMFVGMWYLLMRWRAVGFESATNEVESDGTTGDERQKQHATTSKTLVNDYPYDHYTDAVEDVKQLKHERRHDEAESLLWWCIESAEQQAVERGYDTVPPWYYKHLAIVYREEGRYTDELAVLERYAEKGGRTDELTNRLETARKLAS